MLLDAKDPWMRATDRNLSLVSEQFDDGDPGGQLLENADLELAELVAHAHPQGIELVNSKIQIYCILLLAGILGADRNQMTRWMLSLLLAFSVVLYDQAPLFALMCRTVPQAADSNLADTTVTTDATVYEDGDQPLPDQQVRQVLGEPIEECDSDDLNHEPHFTSRIGFFHIEFRSDSYHPVSFGMVSRISTHLRI